MDSKFQILIVIGISDSFSCIPDSEDQIPEGKIYKQRFPGLRNPDSLTWGDTWESIENTVGQKVKEYRAANAVVALVRFFELGSFRKTPQNVQR